jgi:hypothetical protein
MPLLDLTVSNHPDEVTATDSTLNDLGAQMAVGDVVAMSLDGHSKHLFKEHRFEGAPAMTPGKCGGHKCSKRGLVRLGEGQQTLKLVSILSQANPTETHNLQ